MRKNVGIHSKPKTTSVVKSNIFEKLFLGALLYMVHYLHDFSRNTHGRGQRF